MEKRNIVVLGGVIVILVVALFIIFNFGDKSSEKNDLNLQNNKNLDNESSNEPPFGNEIGIVFGFLDEFSDNATSDGFEISAQVNVDEKRLDVFATGSGDEEKLKLVIPDTYDSDFGNIPINLIFE
jgi:hypothetical protein